MRNYEKITKPVNYKSISLFPNRKVSDKDIEMFKELSIKHDIRDTNGAYNWELAHEVVHFTNLFIRKFVSNNGSVDALRTPYIAFVHHIRKIRKRATYNYKDINRKEFFVDWYNAILDKLYLIPFTKTRIKYLFRHLPCPDPNTYKPNKQKKYESKAKLIKFKKEIINFERKGVIIKSGIHIDKLGFCIRQYTNNVCEVKLYEGEVIKIRSNYLTLLTLGNTTQ